jgi:16S rRNA (guanine527-N7)-methyltransferase
LVDVGSGGGAPGIPLAIARPDAKVLLVESTKKKAAFLERAAAELGLGNLQVTSDRAEDVGQSDLRETFDIATARAVATTDWLVEWCLPLVKVGGKVLAMKGQRAVQELVAATRIARLLGGSTPKSHPVELPGTEHHVIIEIQKVRRTSLEFPRLPTSAKGKPLS